ncbi:hypothetical protein ACA910_007059 [Epithemia clementina (nom. ined.)]
MTAISSKTSTNNKSMGLFRVKNALAAVSFVVGAIHLASFRHVSTDMVSSSTEQAMISGVLPPTAANAPMAAIASPNTRRKLTASEETVPSRIGPLAKMGESEWQNDHNVVHVVNTRFMQHQPALSHLAMARLDLFKAFTLPSMLQQSNQQYMWLIWTDPSLEGPVREEFMALVSDIPNVLVLGAYNEQEGNLRTFYGYDFADISRVVLSGNVNLLNAYHEASLSHVLVETDLDADDAFSKTFIEAAQAQAASTVGHDFRPSAKHSETFCPEYHAEWRFYTKSNSDENHKSGELVHFHDRNFCINSGMTIVYNLDADARRLSPCNNHEEGMCCPDYATHVGKGTHGEHMAGVDEARRRRKLDQREQPTEIIPIRGHQGKINSELPGGTLINTLDFFNTQGVRNLEKTLDFKDIDNQYFFNNYNKWLAAVKGCCLATEDFTDDTLIPDLKIESDFGFVYVNETEGIDVWFDVLTDGDYPWQTTIEYSEGMYALGGFFDLVTGGPGAGIYLDVEVDGVVEVHLAGSTLGFFGMVSTTPFYKIQMTVGMDTIPDVDGNGNPVPDVEEFTIDWLKIAFAPNVPCRRHLRTLPETEQDLEPEMQSFEAAVLMPRTPTAAGMKHVMPGKTGGGQNSVALSTYKENQDLAWNFMEQEFGVNKETVAAVHQRMEGDMANILVDAMNGQCTPGHSCKESTKRALGYLLDQERLGV